MENPILPWDDAEDFDPLNPWEEIEDEDFTISDIFDLSDSDILDEDEYDL